MKTACILLALTIVLFSCKKQNLEQEQVQQTDSIIEGNYVSMPEFMSAQCLPVQYFTVNATSGGSFIGMQGLEVTIPPGILVDNDGQLISGNVEIQLIEALDFDDIIFSNQSDLVNTRPIQTNGHFMVQFSQNGQQLEIADNAYYTVKIARKDPSQQLIDKFIVRVQGNYWNNVDNFCQFKVDTNSWWPRTNLQLYNCNVSPIPNYANPYPTTDSVYVLDNDNYMMRVSIPGWINCGTFEDYLSCTDITSGYKQFKISMQGNYSIKLSRLYSFEPNEENTRLYLYSPYKFVCPVNLRQDYETAQNFSYYSAYYGLPLKFIAFGVDSTGTLYWGQENVLSIPTSDSIPITINMQPSTETQILYNLEDLY